MTSYMVLGYRVSRHPTDSLLRRSSMPGRRSEWSRDSVHSRKGNNEDDDEQEIPRERTIKIDARQYR